MENFKIKIKKEFWDRIVSGEKQYEFRKLSKGLESGTYTFVSVEEKEFCSSCNRFGCQDPAESHLLYLNEKREIFGTAKLRAASLCNPMNKNMSFWYEEGDDDNRIDKGTYDFVKENYIDKDIDFIAYQIMEVKNEI